MKRIVTALIFALGMAAHALTPTTMVSPAPGSALTSSTVTFTWNAGPVGTTGYGLNVGSTGVGSADLINIGPLQGTSVTVKFPTNFTTIYVRLWTEAAAPSSGVCLSNGTCYSANDYTYQGSTADPITGLACAVTSPTADACTVTLTSAAPTGGSVVTLASQSSAVTVPASVTVPAGATTASFTATINPVSITAQGGGVVETAAMNLGVIVVNLAWNAPASTDPAVSYNVYRAPSGSTTYAQINAKPVTATSYTDTTVAGGKTYDYEVESVDASGAASAPSNMAAVVVP